MLVRVEHRFKGGFSLLSAFTWSKLFEDTSFWGPEISGPITEHKLGGEDRPFRLSVAPIYELPVGRGKKLCGSMPRAVDAVLGGWELSGQYLIQSGAPAVFGADLFYDGQDFHLPRDQRTLDRWFDTSHLRAETTCCTTAALGHVCIRIGLASSWSQLPSCARRLREVEYHAERSL